MGLMSHAFSFLHPSLTSNAHGTGPTYALVVLNQRLPRFTPLLWKHAQLRLCADGGANRLYDEMPELLSDEDPSDVRYRYRPDIIKGDMDSIRSEVKEFYANLFMNSRVVLHTAKVSSFHWHLISRHNFENGYLHQAGTKIVDESYDQDTTDLHKCVSFIEKRMLELDKSELSILATGALGGRFDHEVGNINVLYRFSNIRIVLLSDDCLIQLLPKTHHHEIHIQPSIEGPHCGLIPIGQPSARTTTTGLQWDLRMMLPDIQHNLG
ncbi:cAMP-dependent protein kinase subunit [Asimina triloba]